MRHRSKMATVLLLVAAGCAGGSDEANVADEAAAGSDSTELDAADPTDTEQPAEEPIASDPAASGATDDVDDASAVPSASEPVTSEPETTGLRLVSEGAGLGVRPILEWTSVDGADSYEVSVRIPDVGQYWVWSGDSTVVPFGSEVGLDLNSAGPALTVDMSLTVMALDAEGLPMDVAVGVIGP